MACHVGGNAVSDGVLDSPLASEYRDREAKWRGFLAARYPGAQLLRWGPKHRVFRVSGRVVKVEWLSFNRPDSEYSLAYEFRLLEALEGGPSRLNPAYEIVEDDWAVLEMDFVEGDFVEDLLKRGEGRRVSVAALIAKLFQVSMRGVVYKQFRARHIIVRADGTLAFVDFGHSVRTNPVTALIRNFRLLSRRDGAWHWGGLPSLVREITRIRRPADGSEAAQDAVFQARQRWKANKRRPDFALPDHLREMPGDSVAAEHFAEMERHVFEAVSRIPEAACDTIEFKFARYGMAGYRDWGFIWDHLARRLDFSGKRVVDLGCGMGGIGTFARLEGSGPVTSFDEDAALLECARRFAKALRIEDNEYRLMSWSEVGHEDLPEAEIATALSVRLNAVARQDLARQLARYPEVLWQTADPGAAQELLKAQGFPTVEVLVRAAPDLHIIYAAADGCGKTASAA